MNKKQNSNSSAGAAADSSTTAQVTTSSHNSSKPNVVCRFLSMVWNCKIWKFHKWTSAAQKGFPPTDEQIKNGIKGFYDYATMYCERCGHISKLSNRLKCK